ncbi:response regulator [Caulobacter sp. NIBR2454]|uniref:response regulator n=1 Tax=Caulobacter sp. NIBR2454 TaxID=3015996 RepID=UPI0022B60C38|nr:response regulator [Caulobacter sp. NIBR2454]
MSHRLPERPLILAVDDEPDILIALQDLLEDRYDVLTSTSPRDALELLARTPGVEVIISDQRMPGMNGDAFLAAAREISPAPSILLTGYADLSAVVSAINSGGIGGYAAKPWEPGALRAMVASAVERSRLAFELRTEQRLLQALMDNLPAAVAFKDAEGRIVRLNALKAQMLGVSRDEALGKIERELLDGDAGAALGAIERKVITRAETAQTLEERPADGGSRWIETIHVPLVGDTGVEHMVEFDRDVTDQRMTEARLRQADKLQALGTLAGGVAHDFNNLLTAILGSLDLAGRRLPDDPRLRRYIDNASLAAKKGAALTQRLLGFSRQREPRSESIDVNELLQAMGDLLSRSMGGAVHIDWRLQDDVWPAHVEPDQFELAILNLCVNARDAMGETGVVTLSTRSETFEEDGPDGLPPGDYVRVTVADTGAGIEPDIAARIFEPFFTTKDVGKGTGLGLSMVYGFVQRSQGAVTVESTPGKGTAISLLLPRAATPAAERSERTTMIMPQRPVARVLVIDDDASVRTVTSEFVRQLGDQAVEAHGAEAAVAILKQDRAIDIAIVDFAMPGMTGLDFVEAARKVRSNLPIMLVSGHPDLGDPPQDIVVLNKPFDAEALAKGISDAFAAVRTKTPA